MPSRPFMRFRPPPLSENRSIHVITREQIRSVCFEQIVPQWDSTPDTFPDFLPVFSQEEKLSNEKFLSELGRDLQTMPKNPSKEEREEIKKKINQLFQEENIMHTKEHISEELLYEFEENIEGFLEKINAFDETLPMESIGQAMRNYVIYAVIVTLQGRRQNCDDPILGYSLLYPYTDNYIDERRRNSHERDSYNALIRRTLSGEDIPAQNPHEEKTKQLLALVMNYYTGDEQKRKDVAGLLLLMLEAQEKSLLQIHKPGIGKLTADEILRISAYKGGISVLLDYLLSIDFDVSSVTEEERRFYLSLGLILQLTDDLQDIAEDRKRRSRTLVTICRRKRVREATANRLLSFARDCIAGFSPENPELHSFILENCLLVIVTSIAQNAKYFSKHYLEKLEPHLPVSLQYFNKRK